MRPAKPALGSGLPAKKFVNGPAEACVAVPQAD